MARFRVWQCGIKELELLALAISEETTKEELSKLYSESKGHEIWEAAIFKVSN